MHLSNHNRANKIKWIRLLPINQEFDPKNPNGRRQEPTPTGFLRLPHGVWLPRHANTNAYVIFIKIIMNDQVNSVQEEMSGSCRHLVSRR